MKTIKQIILLSGITILCSLMLGSLLAYAVDSKQEIITADSQMKGSARDVEVTRKIREAIMSDDHLSINAQNIKIITIKNSITLEGQVNSKAEKVKIEHLAKIKSGGKRIYNKLIY